MKRGKFNKIETQLCESMANHPVEDLEQLATTLNRSLGSVQNAIKRFRENQPRNEVPLDLPTPPVVESSVAPTRAPRNLFARREGIVVMTEQMSELTDELNKAEQPKVLHSDAIHKPNKKEYEGNFDAGRRY